MPMRRLGLVIGALQLAGCAYSFSPGLPAHLKTVRVPVVRNETTLRGLESDLTSAIIAALGTDGRLRVARARADSRLDVRLVENRRDALREDRLDDAVESQVVLAAEVTFTDLAHGRKLLDRRRVTNRSTDRASGWYSLRRGEFEGLGRREAVRDLARNIVRSVTEIWLDE